MYRGLTRCRMFRRLMTCRSMKLSRLPLMISAHMPRSPSRCSLAPWCAWIVGFRWWRLPDDTFRAEHAVGFAKSRGEDEVLLPAVGDRVAVRRAPGHDMGVIECVLPRRTSFERWRGRARGERQVLCSNVDSVLIVQALGAGEVAARPRGALAGVGTRLRCRAGGGTHQGRPLRRR